MALALYRKYRPTTFGELIGQEHVTAPLIQALSAGRLHHAYLFSGPRGCGKTSSARILARSLNCAAGPTPEPCGECESCRALASDGPGSVDVIEIDAASHGGVDDARDLRERAFFTPATSRYKIYVIDEAHMVSSAGFNALLKLVEEPPEYVKFVFATTEPDKVLPTIKSRTHHYPFRLIPPSVLRPYLEQLCESEHVPVEPAVFPLVVRAGGGSVRDTLSVLDQLIAGAGPEGVTYARAAALLGVTDAALLDELCDALAAADGAAMYAAVDRVAEAGHDIRRFTADLLERLRDLLVLQQVPDAAETGMLDGPEDTLARMREQAGRIGHATLSRCADLVHDGLVEMRGTASPRLLLELVCARMLLPAEGGEQALRQRLEQLEQRVAAGGAAVAPSSGPAPSGPAPTAAAPASPAATSAPPAPSPPSPASAASPQSAPPAPASPAGPSPAGPSPAGPAAATPSSAASPTPSGGQPSGGQPAAGGVDAARLQREWDRIVAVTGEQSKRVAAVAREATVREVTGNTVVLSFQHQVHANMLAAGPQPLLTALRQVVGGEWDVRCECGDRPPPAAGASAASAPAPAAPAAPAVPAARGSGANGSGANGHAAQVHGAGADGADDQGWPEPARPGQAGQAGQAGTAGAGGPAAGQDAAAGAAPASSPDEPPLPAEPSPDEPPPPDESPPPEEPPPPEESALPDDGVDPARDAPAGQGSGEPPALRLLQQTLGAERIGEAAP